HGHFDQLSAALGKGDATGAALALGSLANTVDSRITAVEMGKGHVPDVLQTLRLGRDLYSLPRLAAAPCAADLVKVSDAYEPDFDARKATIADYPPLVRNQTDCFADGGRLLGLDLSAEIKTIESAGTDARAVQKAHLELLLRLGD